MFLLFIYIIYTFFLLSQIGNRDRDTEREREEECVVGLLFFFFFFFLPFCVFLLFCFCFCFIYYGEIGYTKIENRDSTPTMSDPLHLLLSFFSSYLNVFFYFNYYSFPFQYYNLIINFVFFYQNRVYMIYLFNFCVSRWIMLIAMLWLAKKINKKFVLI